MQETVDGKNEAALIIQQAILDGRYHADADANMDMEYTCLHSCIHEYRQWRRLSVCWSKGAREALALLCNQTSSKQCGRQTLTHRLAHVHCRLMRKAR